MIDRPVLVTGAAGMLGSRLALALGDRGVPLVATDRDELDVADEAAVAEALARHRPDAVINAAAWTDVDGAENDEAGAFRLNAEAPGILARACAAAGIRLVHVSTDYVFGGDGPPTDGRPWRIDDALAPVNAYGRTKAAGEAAVFDASPDHLVVRTSWLVDSRGRNFLATMLDLAAVRPVLDVVDDQVGRPTAAAHLAGALLRLLEAGACGVLHVANAGICSWHGLAARTIAAAGFACEVRPCTTERFPRPARRPAWSVLDLEPAEAILGPMPPWETAVDDLVREAIGSRRAAG